MKSFQKVILVIIAILIVIMGILIIDNYTSEDNLFTESEEIYLEDTSVQGIRLTYKDLQDSDSYNFKIVNYNEEGINNNKINYNIEINKSDNIEVELFKGDEKINLLEGNKTENFLLENESRIVEVYKLSYKSEKELAKNDYIEIQIKAWT